MIKVFKAIIFYSLLVTNAALAQTPVCGFDGIYHNQLKDPASSEKIKELNNAIRIRVEKMRAARISNNNANIIASDVYEIPVVVHVIYRPSDAIGTKYNPDDASIQAMIDHINQVYTAGNAYNMGVPLPFRFKLAQRSPGCGATSGIERIDGTSLSGFLSDGVSYPGSGAAGATESSIKKLSIWPVNDYYNIWVVWKISATGLPANSYIAGYANLPYNTAVSGSDGAVLNAQIVNGTSSTLAHEMGHAMGLLHTFEGGDADNCPAAEAPNNCSSQGDLVCDTDPVKNLLQAGVIQDNVINPCTNNAYNGSQRNIMGYGSGLNKFTQGQSDRAIAAFQAARAGFMSSLAGQAPPSVNAKASTPPSDIVNPGNGYNMGPCNIFFNTLSYSSFGYDKYAEDYYVDNSCNIGTTLSADNSYTFSVTTQTNRQVCKAWIDFNNDGIFDNTTENVMYSTAPSAIYTHTVSVTPSRFYAAGVVYNTLLRMRIAADFATNTGFTATSQLQYGQMEDFYVQINAPVPATFNMVGANVKNNSLNVTWTTSAERNNDHYLVEISKDGNTFKELATVASSATGGSSDSALSYSITKSAKEVNSLLGLWIWALLILSLFFYKKNKWLLYLSIFFNVGIFSITACKKKDQIKADQLYIRIKAVSKSGYILSSNVAKAIMQ